jgi:hypothetical protein
MLMAYAHVNRQLFEHKHSSGQARNHLLSIENHGCQSDIEKENCESDQTTHNKISFTWDIADDGFWSS